MLRAGPRTATASSSSKGKRQVYWGVKRKPTPLARVPDVGDGDAVVAALQADSGATAVGEEAPALP
jgi:hypothetical protein